MFLQPPLRILSCRVFLAFNPQYRVNVLATQISRCGTPFTRTFNPQYRVNVLATFKSCYFNCCFFNLSIPNIGSMFLQPRYIPIRDFQMLTFNPQYRVNVLATNSNCNSIRQIRNILSIPNIGSMFLQLTGGILMDIIFAIFQSPISGQCSCNYAIKTYIDDGFNDFQSPIPGQCSCNKKCFRWLNGCDRAFNPQYRVNVLATTVLVDPSFTG